MARTTAVPFRSSSSFWPVGESPFSNTVFRCRPTGWGSSRTEDPSRSSSSNHTGGHLLARVYGFHHSGFPYRDFPLEPYRRFRVHRSGRLFRIQKIVRDSAVQRPALREPPAGNFLRAFAYAVTLPLEQRPVVLFQNIHRIEHLLRYPGPLEGIEIGIGVRVGSHEGV